MKYNVLLTCSIYTCTSTSTGNNIIFWEYVKCVLSSLTEVVGATNYIYGGTHHFCKRREYTFNILPEYYITSRKPVRCTGKLLKIKSKLILILFTFFVEYVFFFFFLVQNVVGKIDKETL